MSSSGFRQSLLEAIQAGQAWSPAPPPILEPSRELTPFLRYGQREGASWPYLPIEIMKSPAWHQYWSRIPHRFMSSGTSQAERSLSPFSSEGLNWYQAESLSWFWQEMRKFFLTDTAKLSGISLIPDTNEWPTSSLAQMMDWIASYFPCERMTVTDLVQHFPITSNSSLVARSQPKWIFGTSIHWMQAIAQDADLGKKLPKGCVLVETGGTKGLHRSMRHADFLERLVSAFPQQQLMSEYGMSELACQAYGRVQQGSCRLSFPPWVKTGVMVPGEQVQSVGRGALWVWDPYRIDLPFPIRTQDIVEISEDGSFQLLGRVPYATLKGCSLNVAEISEEWQDGSSPSAELKTERAHSLKQSPYPHALGQTQDAPYTFGPMISKLLQGFLSDPVAIAALAKEMGLPHDMAQNQFANWVDAVPTSEDKWREMAKLAEIPRAGPGQSICGLFLPPKNHSLALLEAFLLALAAGHQVWLRIPDSIGLSEGPKSFLALVSAKIMTVIPTLKCLSPSVRISQFWLQENAALKIDYLYVHGQTKTLRQLKSHFLGEVYGFGDAWGLAAVTAETALLNSQIIVEHMLHFGQQGCQSLRVLFIDLAKEMNPRSKLQDQIKTRLAEAFHEVLGKHGLDLVWQLSLEHASQSLHAPWKCSRVAQSQHGAWPLLPEANLNHFAHLGDIPMPTLYTLPIVWIDDKEGWQRFVSLVQSSRDFLYLYSTQNSIESLQAAPSRWEWRDLMHKQFRNWSGRHQGLPLYHQV